jgi:hypothetical protein
MGLFRHDSPGKILFEAGAECRRGAPQVNRGFWPKTGEIAAFRRAVFGGKSRTYGEVTCRIIAKLLSDSEAERGNSGR